MKAFRTMAFYFVPAVQKFANKLFYLFYFIDNTQLSILLSTLPRTSPGTREISTCDFFLDVNTSISARILSTVLPDN